MEKWELSIKSMPSAGQPIRRLRDWGLSSLGNRSQGSPWAGAAVLPVAPHPSARCSISAHSLLPPSRIVSFTALPHIVS